MSTPQTFAVADLPRDQQLELLDGVLDQSAYLIELLESDHVFAAPIAKVIADVTADIDGTAFDLVKLRVGADDREVNQRLDRVADFRGRIETLSARSKMQ